MRRHKYAGEVVRWGVEFRGLLSPGETLIELDRIEISPAPGLTSALPTVQGTIAWALLSGGAAGAVYTLRFWVRTSLGQLRAFAFDVQIRS